MDGDDKAGMDACYLTRVARVSAISVTFREPRVQSKSRGDIRDITIQELQTKQIQSSTLGMVDLSLHQGFRSFPRVGLQTLHLKLEVTNLLSGFTQRAV